MLLPDRNHRKFRSVVVRIFQFAPVLSTMILSGCTPGLLIKLPAQEISSAGIYYDNASPSRCAPIEPSSLIIISYNRGHTVYMRVDVEFWANASDGALRHEISIEDVHLTSDNFNYDIEPELWYKANTQLQDAVSIDFGESFFLPPDEPVRLAFHIHKERHEGESTSTYLERIKNMLVSETIRMSIEWLERPRSHDIDIDLNAEEVCSLEVIYARN